MTMRSLAHITLAVTAAAIALFARSGDARACGGCFHDPTDNPSVVTDHRMILTISQDQTTLYDQIQYQGDPKSFAWVLPIHGTVQVGLSADVVFGALDTLTQTQVLQPQLNCPGPPACQGAVDSPSFGAASDSGAANGGGVTVKKDEVVGPYETVQLSATDPTALETWLTKNNFVVPPDVQPIVAAYQNAGFDFLALKLLPGQGIQSMRPVRVTTPGASATLPLRMVSAGTGASVGITLWVIADGRYEPQNFPSFIIQDSELVWDWSTASSNYRTLRAQKEAAAANKVWEIESSMSLSSYQVENIVRNGGQQFGGGFGYDAGADYPATPAAMDGGASTPPDQVREEDLGVLFHGQSMNPRITRMRSDLAHDGLSQDLSLTASADQSEISNLRSVSSDVNRPACPTYDPCPFGSAGFVGAGCAAVPQNTSLAGDAFMLGGLGFAGIAIARRRRNRNKKG